MLYSGVLLVWGVLLAPYLLYSAARFRKYTHGLPQRFGRLPEALRFSGRPTIWIHSCSVGETLSVQPLARMLHERHPDARLVFSTVTATGQTVAAQRFACYGAPNVFYLPIDFASIVGRVLDWIQPSLLVFIDTEIWPNLLHESRCRGIPVILANGRISARSFRGYRRVRPLLAPVFRNYTMLLMQSQEDAERIRLLGAPPERICVSGNLKYDRALIDRQLNESQAEALANALGMESGAGPLIVAGSTHSGEEAILLEALRRIRSSHGFDDVRLLIAPRHPERFEEVASLAADRGFTVKRRTRPERGSECAAVLILDSVGELAAAYRFATVAFVGGTLVPHGGQSILEPALYAKAIVSGPSTENFADAVREFQRRNAIRRIAATRERPQAQVEQLTRAFLEILSDASLRESMGAAGYSVLQENRGAVKLTVEKISDVLAESAPGLASISNSPGCVVQRRE
jgi:3-deoxy-D-manno-octulosonic-acid transferase